MVHLELQKFVPNHLNKSSLLDHICWQTISLSKQLKLDNEDYSYYLDSGSNPELYPIVIRLFELDSEILDGCKSSLQLMIANRYRETFHSMMKTEVEYIMSRFTSIRSCLLNFTQTILFNQVLKNKYFKNSNLEQEDVYYSIIEETKKLAHYLLYKKFFKSIEKEIFELELETNEGLVESFYKFVFKEENLKGKNYKEISKILIKKSKAKFFFKFLGKLKGNSNQEFTENSAFSDYIETFDDQNQKLLKKIINQKLEFHKKLKTLSYSPKKLLYYYRVYYDTEDNRLRTKVSTLLGLKSLILSAVSTSSKQKSSSIWLRNCRLSDQMFKVKQPWIGAKVYEEEDDIFTRDDSGMEVELGLLKFFNIIFGSVEIISQKKESRLLMFQKHPIQIQLNSDYQKVILRDLNLENKIVDVYEKIPEIGLHLEYLLNLKKQKKWATIFSTDRFFKRCRKFIWFLGLVLNLFILFGFERDPATASDHTVLGSGPFVLKNSFYKNWIDGMQVLIAASSWLMLFVWLVYQWSPYRKQQLARYERIKGRPATFLKEIYISVVLQLRNFNFLSFFFHSLFVLISIVYSIGYANFHLILIVSFSGVTRNVFYSFFVNWKSFLLTFTFTCFLVLTFSVFEGNWFYNKMDPNVVGDEPFCPNMIACFINSLNFGLRLGGGLGESMRATSWQEEKYIKRFWFDLIFFLIINLVFLSMVTGLIIDAFGEMREKQESRGNAIA